MSALSARSLLGWVLKLGFSLAVMFVTGEVFLRIVYWDGLSFRHHHGPMVERFERDFSENRYDGPSRGPEVTGLKSGDGLRVLIQGDSITWGQGVKDETVLYSARLLAQLRQVNPEIEMAVLATPGRDIDGHIEQLEKWGAALQPDVIIYQWHVNDIELDKSGRPGKAPPFWQGFFFHEPLERHSFLWFFLNDRLTEFWPAGDQIGYSEYLVQDYARDTEGWHAYERLFLDWSEMATTLTPRVLVVLYPDNPRAFALQEIHDQMRDLIAQAGVDGLDLITVIPEFQDESFDLYAGPFDGHPSADMHGRMADVLFERMTALWPEMVTESSASADPHR